MLIKAEAIVNVSGVFILFQWINSTAWGFSVARSDKHGQYQSLYSLGASDED